MTHIAYTNMRRRKNMKQRKHRLGTLLLCTILTITSILPAGMPVYAKTQDVTTVQSSADDSNSHAGENSVRPVSAEAQADSVPDGGSSADRNAGGNSYDTSGDTFDNTSDASLPGSDGEDGNTGDNSDDTSGDTFDDTSGASLPGSDGENDNAGDNSDNTPDNTSDGADEDSDDTIPDCDADVESDAGMLPEDSAAAPDDILSEESPENPSEDTADASTEYPTEDPLGYELRNIQIIPKSYLADFTADASTDVSDALYFIYTQNAATAEDFFRKTSRISFSELNSSSFKSVSLGDWNCTPCLDDNYNSYYRLSGVFTTGQTLAPGTTYHYRVAYRVYDEKEHTFYYSLLTEPLQFTTGPAVAESAVSIRGLTVDETGYQSARILWTIDNPFGESLSNIRLLYTEDTENPDSYRSWKEISPSPCTDENGIVLPDRYYVLINDHRINIRAAKAALTVRTGSGTKTTIESEEIPVVLKDIANAQVKLTQKTGTTSLQALVELTPFYRLDESIPFTLYYRSEIGTTLAWKEQTGYMTPGIGDSGQLSFTLTDLTENTAYEYFIVPESLLSAGSFEELGSVDDPLKFTTGEIKIYEDSAFPDDVFRSCIKQELGIANSKKITSDKLEALTSLSYPRSRTSGTIHSIAGIEYMDSLRSLDLQGHSITSADELGSLTGLTNICLSHNDLITLPDLSGMTSLNSALFDGNTISTESITEAKLPAMLSGLDPDWVRDTRNSQRGDMEVTLAPEYYTADGTIPFIIKATGLKSDYGRNYKLSLSIDGHTVSGPEMPQSYYDIYYIKDILKTVSGQNSGITVTPDTPCTAVITLTDSYGTEWFRQPRQVTFRDNAAAPLSAAKYIRPDAASVELVLDHLPAAYESDQIRSVVLTDPEGTAVGTASSIETCLQDDNPYKNVFGDFPVSDFSFGKSLELHACIYFARYLPAGKYGITVNYTDDSQFFAADAVCVEDIAVIDALVYADRYGENYYEDSYYDNCGDYLYVALQGINIDPAKIQPVFYENGEAVTEYAGSSITGRHRKTVTYKLKKLQKETFWNFSGSRKYTYDLRAESGYAFVDNIRDKHISFSYNTSSDFVNFEHYNYKKGLYEVKTNSTVADGITVSVSVYSDAGHKTLLGAAECKLQNSLLLLDFRNEQGGCYAPARNEAAYFVYKYTDDTGRAITFDHTNYSVKWYNYFPSAGTTLYPYSDMDLYHAAPLKKLDINILIPTEQIAEGPDAPEITAQLFTKSNDTAGNPVVLTAEADQQKEYTRFTGTWQDSTGLGEGVYTLLLSQGSTDLSRHTLCVYDNEKFYMESQTMGRWSGAGSGARDCYVQFSSEQLKGEYDHTYHGSVSKEEALSYWKNKNFKLELFDRLGTPVPDTDWKIDSASWTGSFFTLYLQCTNKKYPGYYAKISRNGIIGTDLFTGIPYYRNTADASETLGKWHSLDSGSVWFHDDEQTGAYYGVGSYTWPVTVSVTKPYDTDVICSFTITAPDSKKTDFHNFTAAELKGTDPGEIYRITAESTDGSMCSKIGYAGVRGQSAVVNAAGITLNKASINMQPGQTEQLTAVVKPDNTTDKNITWSSDTPAVATIDGRGTVTAVGTGTATVTAATHNQKTASCTVYVLNYSLSHTALSFDLADTGKTETLTVSDGVKDISSTVTWSSTDESVATAANGVVFPVGAGNCKILAAVKDGPTLTCSVTVGRNELTDIAFSDKTCTLYVDSEGRQVTDALGRPVADLPVSKRLKLYITPDDTTAIKTVTWTSSNKAVAAVYTDAYEPGTGGTGTSARTALITAYAAGEATITASVVTKDGRTLTDTCAVTVQEVTGSGNIPAEKQEAALKQQLKPVLTNEQLTLADVPFPEGFDGWEWRYPDAALKPFAGLQEKSFAAQYNDPGNPSARPYKTSIPLSLNAVTGIAIGSESSSLQKGGSTDLTLLWNMNDTGFAASHIPVNGTSRMPDMTAYAERVQWSVDQPETASLTVSAGTDNGTQPAVVLNAKSAGKAVVRAKITFKDGKTFQAQYKITVTEEAPARIQITGVDNFAPDPDKDISGPLQTFHGSLTAGTGTIRASVTNAAKLTVRSSNPKVITAGKAAADPTAPGSYTIPVTIKASGTARITLTANDAAKTRKDIWLCITDVKPHISMDSITVNLQQTTGTSFFLYPDEGYEVTDANLAGNDASMFVLEKRTASDSGHDIYVIKAKENTPKGNYRLSLQGKTILKSSGTVYDYSNVGFSVKVIDQIPKYKVKQNTKVNLFYSDWESTLEFVTGERLLHAELADCDFTLTAEDTGRYVIRAKKPGLTTGCDKKGTLTLRFDGYKDVTSACTINVEKKAPRGFVTNKTVTLYPTAGLTCAVLNPQAVIPPGYTRTAATTASLDEASAKAGLTLISKNGNLLVSASGIQKNITLKAKVTLNADPWAEAVVIPFTVKVNMGKPAPGLQKNTLQLNTNATLPAYDTACTGITWKDGALFEPLGVSVSAADAKAQALLNKGIVFGYNRYSKNVTAGLNNAAVSKGTYKFRVNVRATDTLTVSTPLTVKIVDVPVEKAIKVSAKGSIDVLNRYGTFVTVTPTLKSLNGTITDVRLSGRAAHLFDALCIDGRIFIFAKDDVALITKYNYKVKLKLTMKNADDNTFLYTTPEISLRLKQGKPKVTLSPGNTTFFSGAQSSITRNISATLKGGADPVITNVELLNNRDAFTCSYQPSTGALTIRNTRDAQKGRSYSLQFRVTFQGQADNEKTATVKYTVKVK